NESSPQNTPILESDSLALVSLYNATDGANWTVNTNWLEDGQNVTDWFGVTTVGDRISKIQLGNNNLSGSIPSEIGDLSQLVTLDLNNNSISGNIPSELGTTNLDTLILSRNNLSGPIPDELYGLTSLRRLSISQNQLSGTISPNIANLEILEYLALWDNPFTDGTIPEELWTITSLQFVFLGTSEIGGDISSFTNLTNLVEFWVDQCNVTGIVSSEIGNLRLLERLDISDNAMSGNIPEQITDLSNLQVIEIENNNFSDLPNLTTLENITSLNVSGNNFDFADLEPNATIDGFIYSPQNELTIPVQVVVDGESPISGETSITARVGSEISLTGITGEANNNAYRWSLNGETISNQVSITSTIPSLEKDDVGLYELVITNNILPDLTFNSDPFDLFASAVISVEALDKDSNGPISDRVNAYLFPVSQIGIDEKALPDTVKFEGIAGVLNTSSTFEFPEVLLGEYYVAVESVEPFRNGDGTQVSGAYLPTYFGDALLNEDADILTLQDDDNVDIVMEQFPEDVPAGDGKVSGTITEDFEDENSRIDARRRAAKRKCGLRRKRSGGRVDQNDEFELIAYGETNDNGEFEYGFLPQGTYRFFVEYPGIPLDESSFVEFEIGEAGVSDTEFVLAAVVTEEGITVELVLGITTEFFTDFSIYPNPTTSLINVSYDQILSETVTMELIDMNGDILVVRRLEKTQNGIVQMDMSEYAKGSYLIRFVDQQGDGESQLTYRIIKK
ncbi:MAG: T9SS type A sorting domain-containing protein, partial [Ekhidna sp.]|nr:T9SS type A sorting domain-containing protein [Ekhidna sp.]